MEDALESAFKRHFKAKKKNREQRSLIIVVGDGAPNKTGDLRRDEKAVAEVLRRNIQRLDSNMFFDGMQNGQVVRSTHELGVLFFKVGDDEEAAEFLEHLDDNLEGVPVDAVNVKDIEALNGAASVRRAFVDGFWD